MKTTSLVQKLGRYFAACLVAFSPLAAQAQTTPYDAGIAAMDKSDLKTAITNFDQAVTNDATEWKAYLKRGECLYQLGDYNLAISDFTRVLSKQPKNSDAFLWRANCNAKLGQGDAALKDYKQVLQLSPTKLAVLSQRASFPTQRQQPSLQEEEQQSGARPVEPTSLAAPPAAPTTLHLRADLFTAKGDASKELGELNSAISLDSLNPQLLYKRARVYLQMQKYDTALNDLSDAIMNNPNNASYYLARAFVHHMQGNDILADEDIRQAQFTDPGLPKTIDFKSNKDESKAK